MPYVQVADVDATLASAKRLGANVCMDGTDIPTVGRIGMVVDPQGAMIAVIKPLPQS